MKDHDSYALSDTDYEPPAIEQVVREEARWRRVAAEWPTLCGTPTAPAGKPRATHHTLTAVAVCLSLLIGAALNEVVHAIFDVWQTFGGIH